VADGLSILMPVFNERATVDSAIEDALSAELPVERRELILGDDGSTDGTRELLAGKSLPENAKLLLHDRNLGKGPRCRRHSGTPAASLRRSSTPIWSTAPPISPSSSPRCWRAMPMSIFGTRAWASHTA
jgi:dolichol-phosphate hexosyltransferase